MHGDRVTKADLEAALSAEGLEQALDIIEEGDPREVRRLSRKIRRAGRLDANPLLALVYWLEEVTSNWLPASAKTVGLPALQGREALSPGLQGCAEDVPRRLRRICGRRCRSI
jgi:hypothetical protein